MGVGLLIERQVVGKSGWVLHQLVPVYVYTPDKYRFYASVTGYSLIGSPEDDEIFSGSLRSNLVGTLHIGHDQAGSSYTLSCSPEDFGVVYGYRSEEYVIGKVAGSFTEFIESLQPWVPSEQ